MVMKWSLSLLSPESWLFAPIMVSAGICVHAVYQPEVLTGTCTTAVHHQALIMLVRIFRTKASLCAIAAVAVVLAEDVGDSRRLFFSS